MFYFKYINMQRKRRRNNTQIYINMIYAEQDKKEALAQPTGAPSFNFLRPFRRCISLDRVGDAFP